MLARFEQMLEKAVEGSLRRVFPAKLQPVQLAKAAARAMEEAQVVGLRGSEVPNSYIVRVAPDDLRRFADYRATLAAELARYLEDYAADRGLTPVAPPRVELREDPGLGPGVVRAEARFVDLEPVRQADLERQLEGTRQFRLADLHGAASDAVSTPGTAWLEDDAAGERYPLDSAAGPIRLGRSLDNDIVLTDRRVSRFHAQVQWQRTGWVVQDLGSTNGTFLGEQRVAPNAALTLAPGSVLRFGEQRLRLRVDGPA